MNDVIVLDESFLNTCMFCGKHMKSKGVYDYYCSEECEEKDQKRIAKGIREGKPPAEILFENIKKSKRGANEK